MVINKRILRDLKKNFFRYFAVFVVIAIAMYVVVGMAGSAETVMNGVKDHAKNNLVEDGQFTLFVPLSTEEKSEFQSTGVTIEEHFNIDFAVGESTLRVYKNRSSVDLFEVDKGRLASNPNEIALEKQYCRANEIDIDAEISIDGHIFKVVGIGSTPDYDDVLQSITDASSNPLLFGTAFVTETGYEDLLATGKALGAEAVQYGYRLSGALEQSVFRDKLSKLQFNLGNVKDKYAFEYFDKVETAKNDFSDAVQKIGDGSKKITDSVSKISDSAKDLSEAVAPFGTSAGSVKDAAEGLSKSADQLSDATKDFNESTDELQTSFTEFSDKYLDFTYLNLKEFIEAENNPRINASADDIQINKTGALIAGIIVLILLAYILSAFVTNTIEAESKVIGTLYSMGFLKKELITHYIVLPVIICLLGGSLGTFLGFWGMESQISENSSYFSYPILDNSYSPYLFVYGIVVPFVMAIVVNLIFINRKLSSEPLSLMRKQQRSYTSKGLDLGNMRFINRFRIKLFTREIKSNLTIAMGIFISLLLVMLATTIYTATTTIIKETNDDIGFKYMYYLSFPEEMPPENAETAYVEKFNKSMLGHNFDVSILGIPSDSQAFPYNIETTTDQIYISTSVAEKYNLAVGDNLGLTDKIKNTTYNFEVKKIVNYAPGLFVFMHIDEMRERFNQKDDYYNVLISQEALDIEAGRIYAKTTDQEIRNASEVFWSLMKSLVYVLIIASVILFVLVMYLMVKMIIERQTNNISMFNVFGFTKSEISKLYLRNNLYTVLISAAIFIPVTKWVIVQIYPFLTSNRSVGFNLSFSNEIYFFLIGLIIVSYFISFVLAKFKLNKIGIQEVLKERE